MVSFFLEPGAINFLVTKKDGKPGTRFPISLYLNIENISVPHCRLRVLADYSVFLLRCDVVFDFQRSVRVRCDSGYTAF